MDRSRIPPVSVLNSTRRWHISILQQFCVYSKTNFKRRPEDLVIFRRLYPNAQLFRQQDAIALSTPCQFRAQAQAIFLYSLDRNYFQKCAGWDYGSPNIALTLLLSVQ